MLFKLQNCLVRLRQLGLQHFRQQQEELRNQICKVSVQEKPREEVPDMV